MNLRELAEQDLSLTLEDTGLTGSRFFLIDKNKNKFELAGQVGDIGYLLNTDGAPVQGRTITASYRMSSLFLKTKEVPQRGWCVRLTDLNGVEYDLYVARYEPDRTLGIGRLILSVNLNEV